MSLTMYETNLLQNILKCVFVIASTYGDGTSRRNDTLDSVRSFMIKEHLIEDKK
jgi:hypothetical protein